MQSDSQNKMLFTLRMELEFTFFFKNRKNIITAFKNLAYLRKAKRVIYKIFSKADARKREDIVLEIEKIKNGLGEIRVEKQLLLAGDIYQNLNNKFVTEFSNFEKKLKSELYGDLEKRYYSKEELESMAAKYNGFPKDILEYHSSDKYSEKYL